MFLFSNATNAQRAPGNKTSHLISSSLKIFSFVVFPNKNHPFSVEIASNYCIPLNNTCPKEFRFMGANWLGLKSDVTAFFTLVYSPLS